jgi:hypothetical protein
MTRTYPRMPIEPMHTVDGVRNQERQAVEDRTLLLALRDRVEFLTPSLERVEMIGALVARVEYLGATVLQLEAHVLALSARLNEYAAAPAVAVA